MTNGFPTTGSDFLLDLAEKGRVILPDEIIQLGLTLSEHELRILLHQSKYICESSLRFAFGFT